MLTFVELSRACVRGYILAGGKMAHLKPRRSKCVFTAMVFGLLLALLALPNLVNGQGANATLLGTVTDVSGAVVPNASVQVTNVATGVRQTVTTDSQGR